MTTLEQQLAWLSAREMVAALGASRAPALVRRGLELPFVAASWRLARTLAELDRSLGPLGLPAAAGAALERFGVTLSVSGAVPRSGPCLILANHPGAYDALALMTAVGRRDLMLLAADRSFLRAMGQLSRHFVFVADDGVGSRAGGLKRALSLLAQGGALLHFPAGQIEPDPDFEPRRERWLGAWQPGVSSLLAACARSGGKLVFAGVRGVHSPRTKRLLVNRAAEGSGVSTLSVLLQLVLGQRDVETRVHLSNAVSPLGFSALGAGERDAALRAALLSGIEAARAAG
ncbi:MAG TPA: 1-acyl-sn-glycerol-3-phosphate acyltransferase [Polyangiaceae bacterium]